jgi:ActR/RegA family two-component response regulator
MAETPTLSPILRPQFLSRVLVVTGFAAIWTARAWVVSGVEPD